MTSLSHGHVGSSQVQQPDPLSSGSPTVPQAPSWRGVATGLSHGHVETPYPGIRHDGVVSGFIPPSILVPEDRVLPSPGLLASYWFAGRSAECHNWAVRTAQVFDVATQTDDPSSVLGPFPDDIISRRTHPDDLE